MLFLPQLWEELRKVLLSLGCVRMAEWLGSNRLKQFNGHRTAMPWRNVDIHLERSTNAIVGKVRLDLGESGSDKRHGKKGNGQTQAVHRTILSLLPTQVRDRIR